MIKSERIKKSVIPSMHSLMENIWKSINPLQKYLQIKLYLKELSIQKAMNLFEAIKDLRVIFKKKHQMKEKLKLKNQLPHSTRYLFNNI